MGPICYFIALRRVLYAWILFFMVIAGISAVSKRPRPQIQSCEAQKPIPCAKICGISTTFKSCHGEEGFCNCPSPCPSSSRDNSQICRECRKPSVEQRYLCHKGHCKQAGKLKVEAFVCTDKKNLYCTCFPVRRLRTRPLDISDE